MSRSTHPYLYEFHMHTSEASACGRSAGREMARALQARGYAGAVVTDHFFNGNCAVDRGLSWPERVDRFCLGYERCREAGGALGLTLFFGFEYNYQGAEFLTLGTDRRFLLDHPDLDRYPARAFFAAVHAAGGYIIQAHPFRRVFYIPRVLLFPTQVDAVEGYNWGRENLLHPQFNQEALAYAAQFGLPATCGSDVHGVEAFNGCGMAFDHRLDDTADLLASLRAPRRWEIRMDSVPQPPAG